MCAIAADHKKIYTTYGLNEILDREEKVIIYGAGTYGKRIADYIISTGRRTRIAAFCVTEKSEEDYKGIKIVKSGDAHLMDSDILIIIAVSHFYMSEIEGIVQQYEKRYCCVTQFLYNEIGRKSITDSTLNRIGTYEKLDFLLVGFGKCGTTSLHQALTYVEDVYVPENKESGFWGWYDKVENPKEQLDRDHFYDIREGQIVGAIEPAFFRYAGRTRAFFGKKVKILCLVRNPVDAFFSRFKMSCRGIRNGAYMIELYKNEGGGKYKEGVFEEYCKVPSRLNVYKYIDYIQQFLECWPQEQVKIVVFEDMIKNPQKIMNEILQFIGSSCKYTYGDLPRENEGDYVMADIGGLEIANRWWELVYEYNCTNMDMRDKDALMNKFAEFEEQRNQARKIYNLKLSQDKRKMLEEYYNDSVRELEIMLNRDLSEIWF